MNQLEKEKKEDEFCKIEEERKRKRDNGLKDLEEEMVNLLRRINSLPSDSFGEKLKEKFMFRMARLEEEYSKLMDKTE
jgi:hypothetical protein